MLSKEEIKQILPHREPFLWLDKVLQVEPGKKCTAIKRISPDEPFFAGHFPDNPILPGVIIVEAFAQAGGIIIGTSYLDNQGLLKKEEGKLTLFTSIKEAKFKHPIYPNDEMLIEAELLDIKKVFYTFSCIAKVKPNGTSDEYMIAAKAKVQVAYTKLKK